mmetsp:Transcript_37675/g.97766  ORF Transcript_37675/g.97766 Transcript_37675/m.97766 type:complete len:255 (+) Transcript_37675:313-1077(+)
MQFSVVLTPLKVENVQWSQEQPLALRWLGTTHHLRKPSTTIVTASSQTLIWNPVSAPSIRSTVSLRPRAGPGGGDLEPRAERLELVNHSAQSEPSTSSPSSSARRGGRVIPRQPACQLDLADYCSVYSFGDKIVTVPIEGFTGAYLTLRIATCPRSLATASTADTDHLLTCDPAQDDTSPLMGLKGTRKRRCGFDQSPKAFDGPLLKSFRARRDGVTCGCAAKALKLLQAASKALSKGVIFEQPGIAMSRRATF